MFFDLMFIDSERAIKKLWTEWQQAFSLLSSRVLLSFDSGVSKYFNLGIFSKELLHFCCDLSCVMLTRLKNMCLVLSAFMSGIT
jgi:hypothetical protein